MGGRHSPLLWSGSRGEAECVDGLAFGVSLGLRRPDGTTPKADVVPARPRRNSGIAEGCEARPAREGIHRANRAMNN